MKNEETYDYTGRLTVARVVCLGLAAMGTLIYFRIWLTGALIVGLILSVMYVALVNSALHTKKELGQKGVWYILAFPPYLLWFMRTHGKPSEKKSKVQRAGVTFARIPIRVYEIIRACILVIGFLIAFIIDSLKESKGG